MDSTVSWEGVDSLWKYPAELLCFTSKDEHHYIPFFFFILHFELGLL